MSEMEYTMDAHGSMIAQAKDGSPPGQQEILARGSFVIARNFDRPQTYDETRLIVLLTEPTQHKVVFGVLAPEALLPLLQTVVDAGLLKVVQDSPGMAE